MNNVLISELDKIGVIAKERLVEFYPEVRDRSDVAVLKDPVTGVIVLSHVAVSIEYYENRPEKELLEIKKDRILVSKLDDNFRRKNSFFNFIKDKVWLDFGCGLGGALDFMAAAALEAIGLEPNIDRANIVKKKGYRVVRSLAEIDDCSVDTITLFHVFEHIYEVEEILNQIKRCLKPGGILIIEVPHAKDILFAIFDCDKFKQFTFWSEHLVLHTRQSLFQTLSYYAFKDIKIEGVQRYPLSNHLHWLAKGSPGGHDKWSFLDNDLTRLGYEQSLLKMDSTDTLVAICSV